MNVLIVYAHPEPRSVLGAMRDLSVLTLKERGHAIQVSDLYDMKFNPVATQGDFTDPADTNLFDLQAEQLHASRQATFAPDILEEQQKLLWADLVLFQFPLWWYSMPAILKGWIDRVLAYGYAYGHGRSLSPRRTMLTITTGGPARPFTPELQDTVTTMLDHVQRSTLHFCGMIVLPPFAIYGASNLTQQQRESYLAQYKQVLLALERIPPIDFGR